jgi:hypothetical protein
MTVIQPVTFARRALAWNTVVLAGTGTKRVKQIVQYRLQAEECRRLASNSQDPEHKVSLLRMAESWDSLEAARLEDIEIKRRLASLGETDVTTGPSAGQK